ncbi:MAG: AAA family ATPase [Devosia sp.]|nr:AAA family ATPase [Devosia sp.]MBN9317980.1 AAA family ATPase [Devosia sp.]
MPQWSPQQDEALVAASRWLKDPSSQVFRLFGWAGTGKSTLAKHLAGDVEKVAYGAFTGKAALVMRRRGCADASTIHSLIYRQEDDGPMSSGGEPKWVLNPDSQVAASNLVIIDEVSMVDAQLAMDLLSFGKKVLVLGDPFQLPPVKGAGFFTAPENKPDVMLTEIHRQAKDSPIIEMSIDIREGRGLDYGTYGNSRVIARKDVQRQDVLLADQVLVGTNKTRQSYNTRIRTLKGRTSQRPERGDKVVCLKNNSTKKLLNGMLFNVDEVTAARRGDMTLLLSPEDAGRRRAQASVVTNELFFQDRQDEFTWQQRKRYDEFTYGYALTVHKSQGSQWDSVYLFDESYVAREEPARWLYTGVTRAAESITVVL